MSAKPEETESLNPSKNPKGRGLGAWSGRPFR